MFIKKSKEWEDSEAYLQMSISVITYVCKLQKKNKRDILKEFGNLANITRNKK